MASLSLKYGSSLEEVAEEMVGISCGQRVGWGNGAVLSVFDAVGKSLLEIGQGGQMGLFSEGSVAKVGEEGQEGGVLAEVRAQLATEESKLSACPDCGGPMHAEEGCFKCNNTFCGYSKCS